MHDPDAQARLPVPPSSQAAGIARLSRPTILLHWTVGLSVLALLAFGFWLQTLPSGPDKAPLIQIHKSFGLLVFALALARLFWRRREGFPPPAGPHAAWERRAARAVHLFLLAATILMPVSGILRSLAYARPISLFGVPLVPKLFDAKQEGLYAAAANLHDGLALVLCLAILLHVAAGLRHLTRPGDATLGRMFGLRDAAGPSR